MTPAIFYVSKATRFITEKLFSQASTPAAVDRTTETLFQALKDESSANQGPNQRNLTSKLLAVQSAKGSEIFADEELAHIIDFGLKAGGTDGGALLNSIFYHLIHNRDKLDKLMQELRQYVNDGKLDIVCNSQQAAACSYLNTVIQEALRMLPSIRGILPREVPKGGVKILGHHVSAGVTIGAPAYAMHRLPEVFGPEPTSFVPERWLERGQPNMSRFSVEFGLGSRTCLGKNLAWQLLRKIVPSLLLSLDFQAPEPKVDWTLVSGAGIHSYNFIARVQKREVNA